MHNAACFWNQLHVSLRQPYSNLSPSHSPHFMISRDMPVVFFIITYIAHHSFFFTLQTQVSSYLQILPTMLSRTVFRISPAHRFFCFSYFVSLFFSFWSRTVYFSSSDLSAQCSVSALTVFRFCCRPNDLGFFTSSTWTSFLYVCKSGSIAFPRTSWRVSFTVCITIGLEIFVLFPWSLVVKPLI